VAAGEASEEGVQEIIQKGLEGLQERKQGGMAKRMGLTTTHSFAKLQLAQYGSVQ